LKKFLPLLTLLFCAAHLLAQNTLRGVVRDAQTNAPLADAAVSLDGTAKFAATDAAGRFEINDVPKGRYQLVVTHRGYVAFEQSLDVAPSVRGEQVIEVRLEPDAAAPTTTPLNTTPTGDLPTVTLEEAESDTEGAGEVPNLLHASRDIFQNVAGFGWGSFRFRERGYNSDLFQVFLNGIPFNDPETGWAAFGEFGGLNDVIRNRTSTIGLEPAEFAFAGLGGATNIDLRASNQRKQIRASYASSNRIYRNRVMVTANTGLMPGGWAVSASVSRRWADEGYVPGTFFDGYSYFLSVDKKFGDKHSLNAVVLGAPTKRGRNADSFEEMYALAGTNFYNPLWGWQDGKKRNSQVATNHQPVGILRYDWKPSYRTNATVAAYYQTGESGFTRLNWLNGANPAPDFNRRLPSSFPDSVSAANWADALRADESLRQLDWEALYNANRRSPVTVQNADGIAGNVVSGNQSVYILENQKNRNNESGFNAVINHAFTDRLTVQGGAFYQWYEGQNFKEIEDLLGGEFWTDYDFFGQFQTSGPGNLGQNSDIRIPNNVVRQGEVFGYNYNENIRRAQAWAQAQFNLKRFQFFVAGEVGNTTMWRKGLMQNGRFPDNSLGESPKVSFNVWSAKGGVTFKVNGRNYLYANGLIGTRAPQYRNVFISPRTRDITLPGVTVSDMNSIEGGFIHRSPRLRIRLTGYITNFSNEVESIFANAQTTSRVLQNVDFGSLNLDDDDTFLQVPIFFGASVMSGVDRRHAGMELGIEAKPFLGWSVMGTLATGRHIYTSRPNLFLSLDNTDSEILNIGTVYQTNFYVPRTPQTAGSVGIKYEGQKFWFAGLTANYVQGMWYDFDRLRRTANFVDAVSPELPIFRTINDQIQAPDAFTLDFFGGKSWRIQRKYFVYLNLGVNNLLDKRDIVISGRDSYRNAFRRDVSDPRFYTSEVLYGFGLNYFAQVALRF
jgi:hypothetical protein